MQVVPVLRRPSRVSCLCRTFPAKSNWLREAASIPGIRQVVTRAAAPTKLRKAKPGGHVQSDRSPEQEERYTASRGTIAWYHREMAWYDREMRRLEAEADATLRALYFEPRADRVASTRITTCSLLILSS